MSIISLVILILAHHLGILNKHRKPCISSSTPSCFLHLLLHVTTIFMVDLDLLLGLLLFILWPHLWLLGWARLGKMSHLMAFEAHKMRELLFFLLLYLSFISSLVPSLAFDTVLVEANATLVTIFSLIIQHMLKGNF